MIRRLMAHFSGAGRRGGARLFNTIAERARENHRWARSRSAEYRVEDFQIHFPDSRQDRMRKYATPVAIGSAIVVSVGLVATVAYNVSQGQSKAAVVEAEAAPYVVEGPPPPGEIDDRDGEGDGPYGPVDPEITNSDLQMAGPETVAALSRDHLIIGTGKVTGVYFPAGGAICQIYNSSGSRRASSCTVTSSLGSKDNLDGLRRGDFDIALVQSDWQFHAHEGSVRLDAPGPFSDLRALFSIYVEPITILARRDSGIRHIRDLPGHRIAMGEPGSGQNEGMRVLMSAMAWNSTALVSGWPKTPNPPSSETRKGTRATIFS